jgi:hypothetical protein
MCRAEIDWREALAGAGFVKDVVLARLERRLGDGDYKG